MPKEGFSQKVYTRLFGSALASTPEPAGANTAETGVAGAALKVTTMTPGSARRQDSCGDEVVIKKYDFVDEINPQELCRGINYSEVISLALSSEPSSLPLSTLGATTNITDLDDLDCPEAKIDSDEYYLRNVYNLSEDDVNTVQEDQAGPMLPIRKISGSWQSASFKSNRGDAAEPTSFGSTATDLDLTSTATDFAYENYRRGLTTARENGLSIVPECTAPMMSMIYGGNNVPSSPPLALPFQFAVPPSCQVPYDLSRGENLSPSQLNAQAASLNFAAVQLREAARQKEEAAAYARMQCSNTVEPQVSSEVEAAVGMPDLSDSKGTSRTGNTSKQHVCEGENTTLMLRNLPNDYTRDMLLELLDEHGFQARYNLVYLPVDFKRWAGLGYAFVNMVTHEDGLALIEKLNGFTNWKKKSGKICVVTWGDQGQGLEAHIQRYRNSPVMHPECPEEVRPLLLVDGERVDFPPPTKRLRAPRAMR